MSEVGLVADVGRASVRFALSGGPEGIAPRQIREFSTGDFSTFTGALTSYLTEVGARDYTLASMLAIAGVARGDVVNITNSRWYVTLNGVQAVLRAPARAINDFAAAAAALSLLQTADLRLGAGPMAAPARAGGTYLAIGPGTGLGVAGLLTAGDTLLPIASEAGHARFCPTTDDERRFADMMDRQGVRYCTAERLLSARGLLDAYQLFGGSDAITRAEDVTSRVRSDTAARSAVQLFLGYLGAFAGDMVLAYDAWDGLYLTGAMARALQPMMVGSDFRRRFEDRGDYSHQVRTVPVAVVAQRQLELLGAAAVLHSATARKPEAG